MSCIAACTAVLSREVVGPRREAGEQYGVAKDAADRAASNVASKAGETLTKGKDTIADRVSGKQRRPRCRICRSRLKSVCGRCKREQTQCFWCLRPTTID